MRKGKPLSNNETTNPYGVRKDLYRVGDILELHEDTRLRLVRIYPENEETFYVSSSTCLTFREKSLALIVGTAHTTYVGSQEDYICFVHGDTLVAVEKDYAESTFRRVNKDRNSKETDL